MKRFIAMVGVVSELVSKEFKTRFSRFALGGWWLLLAPVLFIVGISVVGGIALKIDRRHAQLSLVCDLLFWFFFANAVMESIQYLMGHRQSWMFLRNVDIRMLPPVKVISNYLILLVEISVLGVVLFVKHGSAVAIAHLFIISLFFCVFTIGASYMLITLVSFIRDVLCVLPYFLLFLLWVTPVFFQITDIPETYRHYYFFNPLSSYFIGLANGVFDQMPLRALYGRMVVTATVSFICGWGVFHFYRKGFVKRMLE